MVPPVDPGPQRSDPPRLHLPLYLGQQRFSDPPALDIGGDTDDIENRHDVPGTKFAFLDPGARVSDQFPVLQRRTADETVRRRRRCLEPFPDEAFPRMSDELALDSGNTNEVVSMKGADLQVGQ